MRKVVIYWHPSQILLEQAQQHKLKNLSKQYYELVVQDSLPITFSLHNDYVRLVSASSFLHLIKQESEENKIEEKIMKNSAYLHHRNLVGFIIYCFDLDGSREQYIRDSYREFCLLKGISIKKQMIICITKEFNSIIGKIISFLGYQLNEQYNPESEISSQERELDRFTVWKQYRALPQLVEGKELGRSLRKIEKSFYLTQNVEKMGIESLKAKLEKQLREYFKLKKCIVLDKQFLRLKESKTLKDLCRASLYFYTLQKFELYKNLNFILKSVKSIVFDSEFKYLRLYAFLLILNYYFPYSSDSQPLGSIPHQLYRYTDSEIPDELIGQIVIAPSFYSVSSKEQLPNFSNKKTKIVISPITDSMGISLKNIFPVFQHSAYRNQSEYLYLPFTSFQVIHIKMSKSKSQKIVYLKQLPYNQIIKQVIDHNMRMQIPVNVCLSEWELIHQQKYESSKDEELRSRVSYNLGIIHYKYYEKYHLSEQYLKQALELTKNQHMRSQIYNSLGLIFRKQGLLEESQKYHWKALQIYQKLRKETNQDIMTLESIRFKSTIWNNVAAIFQDRNSFEISLDYYRQSFQLLTQQKNSPPMLIACLYNNIGQCILNQTKFQIQKTQSDSDLKQSEAMFIKALNTYADIYALKLPDSPLDNPMPNIIDIVPVLQNLSELQKLKQKLTNKGDKHAEKKLSKHQQLQLAYQLQAIRVYRQSNIVPEEESSTLFYMNCKLAKLLNETSQDTQSIEIYRSVLPLAKMFDDKNSTYATIKMNIGSIYFGMDCDDYKQKWKLALKQYDEAIDYISKPVSNDNLDLYNQISDMRAELRSVIDGSG